jgi:hypothetical protein
MHSIHVATSVDDRPRTHRGGHLQAVRLSFRGGHGNRFAAQVCLLPEVWRA